MFKVTLSANRSAFSDHDALHLGTRIPGEIDDLQLLAL